MGIFSYVKLNKKKLYINYFIMKIRKKMVILRLILSFAFVISQFIANGFDVDKEQQIAPMFAWP